MTFVLNEYKMEHPHSNYRISNRLEIEITFRKRFKTEKF